MATVRKIDKYLQVSFAKEAYKRYDILQKRPIIVSPRYSIVSGLAGMKSVKSELYSQFQDFKNCHFSHKSIVKNKLTVSGLSFPMGWLQFVGSIKLQVFFDKFHTSQPRCNRPIVFESGSKTVNFLTIQLWKKILEKWSNVLMLRIAWEKWSKKMVKSSFSWFSCEKSQRDGVASIGRLLKIQVSFAKEPCKRDDILQKSARLGGFDW